MLYIVIKIHTKILKVEILLKNKSLLVTKMIHKDNLKIQLFSSIQIEKVPKHKIHNNTIQKWMGFFKKS